MKTIMFIALSVFSLSAMAQEKKEKSTRWDKMKTHKPVIMTRGAGITLLDFNNLNARIAGFPQYKGLKNRIYTLSFGSMHVEKNFVSQFTVTGGSSLSGNRNKKSSTLRTLGAGMDLGYDVIPAKNIMLYPLVGLGAEGYQAVFFKDLSAVDFDDVANSSAVQNDIRKTKFTNTFLTYRLGMGVSFKSPKDDGSIGLQVGYVSGFRSQGWKSAEFQSLNKSPKDGLQRFAVTLVFTGGKMMGMGK
jgi:hypothetical protein